MMTSIVEGEAGWRKDFAAFLAARAAHERATKAYHQASRIAFKHLAKRGVPDERAFEIAGVGLADERMIRASKRERETLAALKQSIRGADVLSRISVAGAVAFGYLDRTAVANDDRRAKQ